MASTSTSTFKTHTSRKLRRWARRITRAAPTLPALLASAALLSLPLAAQAADAEYTQRFLTQYNKIKNPANGYFSAEGVPYHSIETIMVEAPDYGHETTSEAYSFWIWLEAQYGRVTGDWAPLKAAWANMERYIIPAQADQPTNSFYNPAKPATYAGEFALPQFYPAPIDSSVPVGQDPIATELVSTYGTRDIYGMHWLLDVDNWYGYGRCGDGTTRPAYINTFQRGEQESVWETVPHPSCETFKWGRSGGTQGFLSLFIGDASYAKQWRYTNAPDADARAIQAVYWASVWADAQGKSADVAELVGKAAKMGDYLRYSMFDKYFKKIGNCVGPTVCQPGTGLPGANGLRDNQTYLMSWYYAWGGALDASAGWAWRVGSSHNHFGYQNPLAAWVLSSVAAFKPGSPSASGDWGKSLTRQLEFYRWLQSAEGAIAGGATNSWGGSYGTPPAGTSTFYGMVYTEHPVYHDPGSNQWFGMQVWSMQRVAEYYYASGDAKAKALLDKWVAWASGNTTLGADGSYAIPSTLLWSGQPDTWNAATPGTNASLHVTVADTTNDVGTTAAFARTLIYYGAKANHAAAKSLAKQLLDRMWTRYQDPQGVAVAEKRSDYLRFDDKFDPATGSGIYVPSGWTGVNAQGGVVDANATFLSLRPKYPQDPQWPKVQAYLNGGASPDWVYHRFWAQADIAMALNDYANLVAEPTPAIVVSAASLSVPEGASASVGVTLATAPAANVAVAVAKAAGGDADLAAASASLTFTPANYNVTQALVITAAEDADQANGAASFDLTAAGLTAAKVTATEVDNDVVVAGCSVNFDTSNDWGSGQVPRIVLQNTSAAAITGWSLTWTGSNDFQITNSWSATIAQSGRNVTATPLGWNATIPANSSVEFGMQLSYSGAKPLPTSLTWQGRSCTIVVK